MKRFAQLIRELDETTKTHRKVESLTSYFKEATPDDAHWALRFLCGKRPKRLVTIRQLQTWCAEEAGIPQWMFDECYEFVGDLAETIALLLPGNTLAGSALAGSTETKADTGLAQVVTEFFQEVAFGPNDELRQRIIGVWRRLSDQERLVFNKLLTGGFRVGASQKLVVRGLSLAYQIDADVVTQRLMGAWERETSLIDYLTNPDVADTLRSRPYPFCLAHSLTDDAKAQLGPVDDWLIERKWDGIRAQIIRRGSETTIWSRGEEIVTQQFPELRSVGDRLPDGTVIDGEILVFRQGGPAGFAALQRRLGRKNPGQKLLREYPVRFAAFDLLECGGADIRSRPLGERRTNLEELIRDSATEDLQSLTKSQRPLRQRSLFEDHDSIEEQEETELRNAGCTASSIFLSEQFFPSHWEDCSELRGKLHGPGVEGLMLKHRSSVYEAGRATGQWWKWKVEPYRCDAVLVYAQRGHGRRAGLYTDYTFAVWDQDVLVPFTKAYSGLTDAELQQVDQFVQANTLEKFGPVRKVEAQLVFELAFEGIQRSDRHKAGIAVRFPRIVRIRSDKTARDADTLEMVRQLASAAE